MSMMFGYGKNNVPYMASMYGHGSGKGGISNGITGKDGLGDGSGIDFKSADNGNEWRWSEQWIPRSSSFLQAVTAMKIEQCLLCVTQLVLQVSQLAFFFDTSFEQDSLDSSQPGITCTA